MTVAAPRRLPGIRFERRAPEPEIVLPRMDVAAFVGIAASGPLHTPVPVEDEVQFAALFGGDAPLAWDPETGKRAYAHLALAVRAFFRNGGRRCWIVRVAGDGATSDRFEIPGLALLTADGLAPAVLPARSEGSWADGLRIAAGLQAATLALVHGGGDAFTFATSRPGELAPGDLVRITSDTDVVLFPVRDVEPASSPSPLPGDGREQITATAAALVRLLRDPPAEGSSATAEYRDDAGRVRRAPAVVAGPAARDELAIDLVDPSVPAPAEGALLRLELSNERVWMTVDDVRSAADGGSPLREGVRVRGALGRPAPADEAAAYGPGLLAERLTFELSARLGQSASWRLDALGFAPGHERYAGDLPTDCDLYRSHDGARFAPTPSLWPVASAPRFPLAGLAGDTPLLIPVGMPFSPVASAGPLAQDAFELARDGLEPFNDRLFLDDALRDNGTRTLLASADALRLEGPARALRGIHALFGVDEPTIVAVPDAVQRTWRPADAPAVPVPDALDPLFRPEWWRFLPCAPPPPADPLAVPVSEHYLCAGERIAAALTLAASEPARGGFELTWTASDALPADTEFVLEEATAPDWTDAAVTYRGPDARRRVTGHAGTSYHRVRAEVDGASSDWSNPVAVHVEPRVALAVTRPESGHFLACDTHVLAPPDFDAAPVPAGGTYTLSWGALDEPDVVYAIEEATRTDWADAHELQRGPERTLLLLGRPAGSYHYRVRALVDGLSSDWSAPLTVVVAPAARAVLDAPGDYDAGPLLTVQRALMRLCAARGDLFAVLALPGHYREDEAIAHARALTTGDPLDDDSRTRSFAALYHPWLTAPQADDPQAYRVTPPDGAAAGVMAARAARRGAWIAPANEQLRDVVLLSPRIRPEALGALQEAQVNVVRQEPRGFLWLGADTLSPDADLRPIGTRRLLSLLRRVALLEGAGYVFEPNDATLRRAVQRGFEAMLLRLYSRGAFSGDTSDEAFRVVTGSPPNTPQSVDAGRLIVELKVAPAQPLAFLTVRLVQAGDGSLTVESR